MRKIDAVSITAGSFFILILVRQNKRVLAFQDPFGHKALDLFMKAMATI
jgi:hypothetical protein